MSSSFPNLVDAFTANLPLVGKIYAILFGVFILNWLVKYRLNVLGILPRHIIGIPGIFFSPFLHGSFAHLGFNAIPLFLLMNLILVKGQTLFFIVSISIILLTGIACWLFARKNYHLGASGVIMGYFGYLIINAIYQPNLTNILLGVVCLYYLSGLFYYLIPRDKSVSWESHVFGFIAGICVNYLLPYILSWLALN